MITKKERSSVKVPYDFNTFSGRQISRIASEWHLNFPEIIDPRAPRGRVAAVKMRARAFYNKLRESGCDSPRFGRVEFTLRGWRHITAQNKSQTKVIRSMELLGAAVEVISKNEQFRLSQNRCSSTGRETRLFSFPAIPKIRVCSNYRARLPVTS